jgi:hypothetical protein
VSSPWLQHLVCEPEATRGAPPRHRRTFGLDLFVSLSFGLVSGRFGAPGACPAASGLRVLPGVSWEGTRRATQRHDGIRIDLREACRSSVTRSVCGTWEMQRYFPRNGPRANAGDKWRGRPLTPRCTICCSVYCPVYHHTAAAAPLRFAALGSGAFTKRSHPDRQTDRQIVFTYRTTVCRPDNLLFGVAVLTQVCETRTLVIVHVHILFVAHVFTARYISPQLPELSNEVSNLVQRLTMALAAAKRCANYVTNESHM